MTRTSGEDGATPVLDRLAVPDADQGFDLGQGDGPRGGESRELVEFRCEESQLVTERGEQVGRGLGLERHSALGGAAFEPLCRVFPSQWLEGDRRAARLELGVDLLLVGTLDQDKDGLGRRIVEIAEDGRLRLHGSSLVCFGAGAATARAAKHGSVNAMDRNFK
jgi:hypothetical protein